MLTSNNINYKIYIELILILIVIVIRLLFRKVFIHNLLYLFVIWWSLDLL